MACLKNIVGLLLLIVAVGSCSYRNNKQIELRFKAPQAVKANANEILSFYLINIHGIPGRSTANPLTFYKDYWNELRQVDDMSNYTGTDITTETIVIPSTQLNGATNILVQILAVYMDKTTFTRVFYYDD